MLKCHQSISEGWCHLVSVGLNILSIHCHKEVPGNHTSHLRNRAAVDLKHVEVFQMWTSVTISRLLLLIKDSQSLHSLKLMNESSVTDLWHLAGYLCVTIIVLYLDSWQISVWIPDPWQLTVSGNRGHTGGTSPWHLEQRGIRIL